jgi:hypothetical protein
MSTFDQLDWQETLDIICRSSAHQILEGISFAEFRLRMEGMVPRFLTAGGMPKKRQSPEMLRSIATLMALETDLAGIIARWPEPACHYQLSGGVELTPKKDLTELELDWMDRVEEGDFESAILFLGEEPLAGQSFRILRDVSEMIGALPENLPGGGDALGRQVLERGEALRRLVLGRLKAFKKELPWGFLDNRPLLTLVSYYIQEFAETRPEETLDLMCWSVNIANPTDNIGLRQDLIHTLVATGLADEAIAIAARYPDDFASTEYGRVLALFAGGRLDEAETALKQAAEKSPKVKKCCTPPTRKDRPPRNRAISPSAATTKLTTTAGTTSTCGVRRAR